MKTNKTNQMLILIVIAGILCVLGGIVYFVLRQKSVKAIDSYEDCVAAGYPIMESYPEQCATPDGRSFTRELTEEEKRKLEEAAEDVYYGQSTIGLCKTNNDCVVTGCNNEICQSEGEDPLSSVCIAPEDPLPQELGYGCECVDQGCEWSK